MRAIIVGAGIGGLAAAVALRKVGIDVLVLERSERIQELGAGLSLWSNAVRALRELGLEEQVVASASSIGKILTLDASGRLVSTTDVAAMSREAGAACICIHRPTLQQILVQALPPASIRTGAHCLGFENSAAVLDNGERIAGDLLIGADGITSAIRQGLHGKEAPRYAGYTCWRGICRDDGDLPHATALLALGGGMQCGVWPCGEGKLYWFLTRNAAAGTGGGRRAAIAYANSFAAPIPQVIERTSEDAVLQNDILDRPPLRNRGRGPVTLLGDAAHAATPNLGQGACQALEDAVYLAACLRGANTEEAGLRAYESQRIPRTAKIVRDSWRMGRVLQTENPALEWFRNLVSASTFGQRMQKRMFRDLLEHPIPKL